MDILAAGRLYIQDIGHEPCILAEGIEANEGERFFFFYFSYATSGFMMIMTTMTMMTMMVMTMKMMVMNE